jgi:hypothetical protein
MSVAGPRDGFSSFLNRRCLDLLHATLSDPSSFRGRDYEVYTPEGALNRLRIDLGNIAAGGLSHPYHYLDCLVDLICTQVHDFSRYGVQVIGKNHGWAGDTDTLPMDFGDESITIAPTAMVRFAATWKSQQTSPRSQPPPILTLLDLNPTFARRHSSHATIAAYLLSLAQVHLRYHPKETVANPFLIAIRYKTLAYARTPVYIVYTARITRRYLDSVSDCCVSGHQHVEESINVCCSPEYHAGDKKQMAEFSQVLLELCPRLVRRAVQESGGEAAVMARAAETQRVRMDEWFLEQEKMRQQVIERMQEEEKKMKRARQKKRRHPPETASKKKVKGREVAGNELLH